MAKLLISMLTLAVVVAAFLQTSRAQTQGSYTCYSCTSLIDSNCGEKFSGGSGTVTCTGPTCSKSIGSIGGVTVVSRGCGTSSDRLACDTQSVGGYSATQCNCQGNNCNTATGIYPGHVTGALMLAASLALTFIGRRLL